MGAVQLGGDVAGADEFDRLTDHRAAKARLQPALVARVVDARAGIARHGSAALRDDGDRSLGVTRELLCVVAAAEKLTERAIGRADAVQVPVEQNIGDTTLLLNALGERREGSAHRADVDNEIGLERGQRVVIDAVAVAAGEPGYLGPRGDIREQEFARLRPNRFQPANQKIGRERIDHGRCRRTGRIDASHAVRRRDSAAGRISDARGEA